MDTEQCVGRCACIRYIPIQELGLKPSSLSGFINVCTIRLPLPEDSVKLLVFCYVLLGAERPITSSYRTAP